MTENDSSMAVINPTSAALVELFLNELPVIPKFAGENQQKFVFGSTLAPWPNRLEDGRFSMGSRIFEFDELDAQNNKNHGLVLNTEFEVVDQKADSVTLTHTFGAENGYPFRVELEITYELLANGLKVIATAKNHGDLAPFAIGFHPYFLTGKTFEVSAAFTHRGVSNERMLPVAVDPIPGLHLDQDSEDLDTLDHCFMGASEVVVTRPEGSFVIRALENLPYFMLYRPKDQIFVEGSALAIEPMSAPANIFRNDIESVLLAPGESKSYSYEIRRL